MNTKDVIEALLYKNNNDIRLRNALQVVNVININENRNITSKYHPELEKEMELFDIKDISIMSSISSLQVVLIFKPESQKKNSPIIIINGENCQITRLGIVMISRHLDWNLTSQNDFIPRPFLRKIIGISNLTNENNGDIVVVSEYLYNQWIVGDALVFNKDAKLLEMRSRDLCRTLVGTVYEEDKNNQQQR